MKEQQFLIIGGVPKAGTTSLYRWLAAHPQVCGSSLKETRFFLDKNNPLDAVSHFDGNNLEDYESFFSDKDCSLLRLEATPDYLYSQTAPEIANLLPNSRIVFILREPVERLVSWYNYSKQRGFIATTVSFDDYINQMVNQEFSLELPVHLHALEQCKYEKYLCHFRKNFNERMMVIDFSDLKLNPMGVVKQLCEFSGLDASFYDDFEFQAANVSYASRFPKLRRIYARTKRKIRFAIHEHRDRKLFQFLKLRKRNLKLMLQKKKKIEKLVVSKETKGLIRDILSKTT